MNHKEAFMLMQYQCLKCSAIEIIWNSRDGVTPFSGPSCRSEGFRPDENCGEETRHINWDRDVYAPDYKPQVGERIWRDGTLDMMRDIKRRMVERSPEYLTDDMLVDGVDAFIEKIAISEHGEGGWPALVDAHTGKVDGL